MLKIKICGQPINVFFTNEPVIVDGNPAYGYADYTKNEIVIGIIKTHDAFSTFLHEVTHMFNVLTLTNIDKESKFNEEDRAHYVSNVISALIRENGVGIFEKFNTEWKNCLKGAI